MKDVDELYFPGDVRYTDNHEWARSELDNIIVGITDYAQDQLGDIVYVELPEVGSRFNKGDEFGAVESVKAVSELYIPVGGEVLAVNTSLEDYPELVNTDPYKEGWMIEVKPDDLGEIESLKDKEAYLDMLKG